MKFSDFICGLNRKSLYVLTINEIRRKRKKKEEKLGQSQPEFPTQLYS